MCVLMPFLLFPSLQCFLTLAIGAQWSPCRLAALWTLMRSGLAPSHDFLWILNQFSPCQMLVAHAAPSYRGVGNAGKLSQCVTGSVSDSTSRTHV
jgi:hypothetical protein